MDYTDADVDASETTGSPIFAGRNSSRPGWAGCTCMPDARSSSSNGANVRPTQPMPPFDAGLLRRCPQREPANPPHRVDGLNPVTGRDGSWWHSARPAEQRTISTSPDAFITGEDFLGRFPVRRIDGRGRLPQLRSIGRHAGALADDVGVPRDPRYTWSTCAAIATRSASRIIRAKLAKQLHRKHEDEVTIFETRSDAPTPARAARTTTARSSAWLGELDRFAHGEVGAIDVVSRSRTHAARTARQSRGASALEDWGDSLCHAHEVQGRGRTSLATSRRWGVTSKSTKMD